MLEGLQERLLNRVLRVFPIVCDVFRNSEEFAIVSLHEFLESRYIATLSGMDKIQIPCPCLRCELCRVCRHIRSTRLDNNSLVVINAARNGMLLRCNVNLEVLRPHCTTTFPVIFGWTEQ